ncbi:alpha/beta fold hydrolase [Conexibacter sp. JD483]|uniref:alpha/beta fold hydrolase n=1 Tax=unclassified Conexibacter TaxID=2627773 RepID=UPI00271F1E70|nr:MULTISPECIES: alpha/beta fold hydrolase [unclassified Conexibacter]MDO8185358.1 alpha/beta fold hydrolase [Conexibacter sp. CPCC 205706]MDO8198466.1 alpha/beta fold hydrolase [Conexibacter sp. CPCC 205762]MDR9368769.1 alpha/beta fold hydrolase [Conexibacter sp. JD483]
MTALDRPPTLATVPLAYDRIGSGPPLVLVHGLGGERHVWEPLLAPLGEHHTLVIPDLPGFGASPQLPAYEPATAAALAASVARLLDELGIVEADVVGNSLGGWVSLELALLGRARTVTALCPAGFWTRPLGPRRDGARRLAQATRRFLPLLTRSGRVRQAALAGTVAHPERVPPRSAARMISSYASAPGFLAADAAMRASRFARIADLDVPVTLAWGERDRLLSPPRALPDGVVSLSLPDCGHLPMWDDPRLVARVVLDAVGRDVTAHAT